MPYPFTAHWHRGGKSTAGAPDEWALFEKTYFEHGVLLYHFIHRRIRNSEKTRDLLHDVFVRFWMHRGRLDPDKPVKPYLYKIASNIMIDHMRKQRQEEPLVDDHCPGNSRPDHQLEAREAIDALLQKMPPKIRNVFLMSRLDGFSYNEMAEICGVSVKTIEAWMGKAIKILCRHAEG